MSAIILFVLVMAAIVCCWLWQQRLTARPWLETGVIDEPRGMNATAVPPAKIGLWVFMAVASALMMLLVSASLMRMHLSEDWRPLPVPRLLWFNTAVLALSSLALHRASLAARRGWLDGVRINLASGGALAFAFLAGQYLAWRAVMEEGFLLSTNPSSSFFYLITTVHGLHLAGGLAALGRITTRSWQGLPAERLRLGVELCATYWHFLLLAWLVLFGLILHS